MDVPTCDKILWIKIMVIQTENRPREDAAGILNLATLNELDHTKKATFLQDENDSASEFGHEPFPSFFQLVAANAEAPMGRAFAYLRNCAELASVGAYDGWCESCDNFLDAGREIAKLRNLLKIPKVYSNEAADRLEEKAAALHNLADMTDMQAGRIRASVTL
jgi:hypothetical protein